MYHYGLDYNGIKIYEAMPQNVKEVIKRTARCVHGELCSIEYSFFNDSDDNGRDLTSVWVHFAITDSEGMFFIRKEMMSISCPCPYFECFCYYPFDKDNDGGEDGVISAYNKGTFVIGFNFDSVEFSLKSHIAFFGNAKKERRCDEDFLFDWERSEDEIRAELEKRYND